MSDETMVIKTETLKALFDLVVGSLNYGSGFYGRDDVEMILEVATMLGALDGLEDPNHYSEDSYRLTEPHLWHQDCALPWRCGKPSGDPIHHVELPA